MALTITGIQRTVGGVVTQNSSLAQVRAAARARRRREEAVKESRAALRQLMTEARDNGVSDAAIAEAAGLTKARVGQILGPRRNAGT